MTEQLPASLVLQRGGPLTGTVAAPASKSHTNRALAIAALADGESRLLGPLVADDSRRMIEGLRALGVQIDDGEGAWVVAGTGGQLGGTGGGADRPASGGTDRILVDAGDSGTTMRFLTALATLSRAEVGITGSESLLARPIGPLVEGLRQLGCDVMAHEGRPPVTVRPGPPKGGRADLDASLSSQFASALCLVSPYADGEVELVLSGLGAAGYVEMTLEMMTRWGAQAESSGGVISILGGRHYRGQVEQIAGDASAAAHLFALAVATRGEVTVTNLARAGAQPDMGVLGVLSALGVEWRWEGDDAAVVTGPDELAPIEVDLSSMPDLLPVVAVLASLAFGRSRLTGLGVTRHHESDRVSAVATELAKLGITTEASPDSLVVNGGGPQGMVTIDSHGDHRIAMAFAALGARLPFIIIKDPSCVTKTYPGFWEAAHTLGLGWKETLSFKGLKF
ncbi:MAG: 3-phosphoshikimate 1-carboxyvinyltransferase [Acidimicrobiales bacterium]